MIFLSIFTYLNVIVLLVGFISKADIFSLLCGHVAITDIIITYVMIISIIIVQYIISKSIKIKYKNEESIVYKIEDNQNNSENDSNLALCLKLLKT